MSTDNRQKPNVAALVQQHHEEEHHLMDYVRVLYKRRWVAIPAFLIVFLIGSINSFRTTPIYEASTQLLIEKDSPKIGRLDTMFQDQDGWYNDEFYQTQYRILQSRSLARHTAEVMDLPNHPSLKRAMEEPTAPLTFGGVISTATEWVGGLFRSSRPATTPAQAAATAEPGDKYAPYAGLVLGSLTVAPVRNSRLVELRFSSTDPKLAADMANAHAKAYIQQNMEMRFSASKEASDWLGGQLAEQRKKVEESEAALQRYKESHDAVAVEDRQNIVVQRLADLNSAATKAKTGRIEKRSAVQPAEDAPGHAGGRRVPGRRRQRLHPEAEVRDRRPAAAAGAARRQVRRAPPRDGEGPLGDRVDAGEVRQRGVEGHPVGAGRVRGRARAGTQPGRRARGTEDRGPRPEPQGHRVLRAVARGREQPSGLRGAAAAHEGDRDLRRAQDQQHPGRRRGGSARARRSCRSAAAI